METTQDTTDPRLLLLNPQDNCLIAIARLAAGTQVRIDGERVTLPETVDLGHKLARRALARGEKVLRYGAVIGHATGALARGAHLHTHNLASDYLPTRTPDADQRRARAADEPISDKPASESADEPASDKPANEPADEPVSDEPASEPADELADKPIAPAGAAAGRDDAAMSEAFPADPAWPTLRGYPRGDGRKGIRNVVAVAYLVECAHHVAREIAAPFRAPFDEPVATDGDHDDGRADRTDHDDERAARGSPAPPVHLIGFPGCYPNDYAEKMLQRIATHPNVGAVLFVSLGCESMNRPRLADAVRASGRPVRVLTIQQEGGTRGAIRAGIDWVRAARAELHVQRTVPMSLAELVVGTICGGSDGTSGITANPAVGRAFDHLIDAGATCLFEETGELVGCEFHMQARAARPALGAAIVACIGKAARYYATLGHGSFAPGNADGGLTTQEEKSLGAYAKSGGSPIVGLVKPGDLPPTGGLYLLDVVPDGEPRFGFPNISDNAEIGELIACGAHVILFATGRGSVVGSAIAPVVKVCANPLTYRNLADDMDVDAGRILEGRGTLDEVGREVFAHTVAVAQGRASKSERLGHQEFIMTYKSFAPVGPGCLPPHASAARGGAESAAHGRTCGEIADEN